MLIERFLYDRRRGGERCSPSIHPRRKSQRRGERERHSESSGESNNENYGAGVHMCLVSEKLGLSLFAFLSQNKYRGFFIQDIQQIALEVLKSLAFLRKIRLTHTDLKVGVCRAGSLSLLLWF